MKGETTTTRNGIANECAEFCAQFYEDDKGEENTRKTETETCTESQGKIPGNFEPIPEFTTSEIQDAIDSLKKGGRETAVGSEQNRSKIAVMRRRKR